MAWPRDGHMTIALEVKALKKEVAALKKEVLTSKAAIKNLAKDLTAVQRAVAKRAPIKASEIKKASLERVKASSK